MRLYVETMGCEKARQKEVVLTCTGRCCKGYIESLHKCVLYEVHLLASMRSLEWQEQLASGQSGSSLAQKREGAEACEPGASKRPKLLAVCL